MFGRYERKIGETSSFESELELLPNLEDTEDFLANFLAAVTARLTAKLALFATEGLQHAVVNLDDPFSARVLATLAPEVRALTISRSWWW